MMSTRFYRSCQDDFSVTIRGHTAHILLLNSHGIFVAATMRLHVDFAITKFKIQLLFCFRFRYGGVK